MRSFESQFIKNEVPRFDQVEFQQFSSLFLDHFLNVKHKDEFIRVPLIGKYLKFHPVSFADYELLLENNIDLLDDSFAIFFQAEVDIQLHCRDFLKEFIKRDNGLQNLFSSEFLLDMTDSSFANYVSLDVTKFTSLLTIKTHLESRMRARAVDMSDDLKFEYTTCKAHFLLPSYEYAVSRNTLKIVLELRFK